MGNEKMQRVNHRNPCPVCKKSDWCLVAPDGTTAICQRIKDGSVKQCGDAGYLHILIDRPKRQQHRLQRSFTVRLMIAPGRDFTALYQQYSRQITSQQVNDLIQQLGVSTQSLKRLRIGWDGQTFTFPMSNSEGQIIGIRRRFPDGRKTSIIDSKTGLFIPRDLEDTGPLLITEGPTDCATALDLGFNAIGRPNCNSKVDMITAYSQGRSEIIIIGDNDAVGKDGAEKLAGVLVLHCQSVKIIYPPNGIKDLRQWKQNGLVREKLLAATNESEQILIKLSITTYKAKN